MEAVKHLILREKLIAIVRGVAKEKLLPLAAALFDGGIRCMEITYCADGTVSDKETAEQIQLLANELGDCMAIGAGTVLTAEQVSLTKDAGGTFIISPNTDPTVIRETCKKGLVSIPGALTPSEIAAASQAGADFVKLFPVSVLGPDYIKAVTAPLSHVKLLAVGGINRENISSYGKAGVCGFGLGSGIIKKSLIESHDFQGITALANAYVQAVREAYFE